MAENDILITGYGNIGRYLYKELEVLQPVIYDKYIPDYAGNAEGRYGAAFICVPTEMLPDGSADISAVEDAVSAVNAEIIVIKSTVPVGTSDALANKYNKRIVFSPEYYGTTQHSLDSPDFLILGGDKRDCAKIAQLFYKVKNGSFQVRFTDRKTAEFAKYMVNCFLALKVTFCCEFKEIADKFDIIYEELRELFVMDERAGSSHTFVYEDKPYYDSHCFNKDVRALIKLADNPPLMSKMNEINLEKKGEIRQNVGL